MADPAGVLDPERAARNHQALADHDLDAVICRLPENVLVLTGYWPLSSNAVAVVSTGGERALLVTDLEAAEVPLSAAADLRVIRSAALDAPDYMTAVTSHLADILRSAGLRRSRVGWEASFESVAPGYGAAEIPVPAAPFRETLAAAAPSASLRDATALLNAARARKTPRELAALGRANAIAGFGLEVFRSTFEPGRREIDVAAAVEAAIMSRGAGHEGVRHARGWAQLMTGTGSARAYSVHPASSTRIIEAGDLGVLELATVADGYWSDLTRTGVAGGRPNNRQAEMFDALVAAHRSVRQSARAGMTGGEVDALAREEIERRGFGPLFVHQTGHGLGFRYHEPVPSLHPADRDIIQAGMVSSVEPGLYLEGFGGMRLEENVVFTAEGIDLLSLAPIELSL